MQFIIWLPHHSRGKIFWQKRQVKNISAKNHSWYKGTIKIYQFFYIGTIIAIYGKEKRRQIIILHNYGGVEMRSGCYLVSGIKGRTRWFLWGWWQRKIPVSSCQLCFRFLHRHIIRYIEIFYVYETNGWIQINFRCGRCCGVVKFYLFCDIGWWCLYRIWFAWWRKCGRNEIALKFQVSLKILCVFLYLCSFSNMSMHSNTCVQ